MFAGDGAFTLQIFLFHVVVGHFGCQILGGNRQCRQKIRKGTGILDAKAVLHFLRGIPTEERTIPLGTNAAKTGIIDPALINILGKAFLRFTQSAPGFCALNQRNAFLNQFLLSGLHGKIALGKSDFFLFGIAVLRNQITGITRQHIVLHRSAGALAGLDHFRDLTKMIRHLDTAGFTGFHCTGNSFIKVFPSPISQQGHQLPGIPEFNMCALIAMYHKVKLLFDLADSLFIHYISSA